MTNLLSSFYAQLLELRGFLLNGKEIVLFVTGLRHGVLYG
jgi:hypothetical protein